MPIVFTQTEFGAEVLRHRSDVAEVLAAVEPRLRRLLDGGWIRKEDVGDAAQERGVVPWSNELFLPGSM